MNKKGASVSLCNTPVVISKKGVSPSYDLTIDINIGKLDHFRLGNRKQYKDSKSNGPLKLIFDCYESKQNVMSQLSNLKHIENKKK